MDAGKSCQGTADLGARGVAVGVQNAREGVRALAGAQQLAVFGVEGRTPLDQLRHPHRPLGHQRVGRGPIDQPVARVDRVFEVQSYIRVALHGNGDAALSIVCVRLGHRLLGDHQNLAVARQLNRRAQPGHARPHHQKIYLRGACHKGLGYHCGAGEQRRRVRHSLGLSRDCPSDLTERGRLCAKRESRQSRSNSGCKTPDTPSWHSVS